MKRHDPPPHRAILEKRLPWVTTGVGLAALAVLLRLAYLQIAMGDLYAAKALENRIHPIPLKSQRGMIYGRDESTPLASNRAACDVVLVPNGCAGQEEEVCALLGGILDVEPGWLLGELEQYASQPFTQIPVKRDISRSRLLRVEEHMYALPGVYVVVRPQRRYEYGPVGGQVLGWINEVSPADLERLPSYRRGDLIGRAGLEEAYEAVLRGEDGIMMVSRYNMGIPMLRTDAHGNPILGTLGAAHQATDQRGNAVTLEYHENPQPGRPIHVSLDMELQAKAEDILRRTPQPGAEHEPVRGSIAVLNARNGEVLALASVPSYDPNVFVSAEGGVRGPDGISPREELLSHDRLERMKHRAYQEQYPPGSVYKVMMAVAALEEGVIDEHTTFFCPGHFTLGNTWNCWKKSGHGHTNVVDALAYSCDVFFYNVGLRLGIDRIKAWSTRMGLGVETGIDLPREVSGLVPSPEWKARQHPGGMPWERKWHDGETVNASIGQGQVSLTTLQVSVMMSCLLNGGRRVRPFVNLALEPAVSPPFISENTLRIVREGMRKCVEKRTYPTGTGRRAYIEGMTLLGKTGTSQVVSASVNEGLEDHEIPFERRDHGWFVVGVPDEEPPLSICVMVEHGLHGSDMAPLAKELIEFFYARQKMRPLQVAGAAGSP